MSTSVLSTTNLDFLSGGSTQAKLTGSADTFTLEGTSSGTCLLTGLSAPTSASDAANKSYVDNAIDGLSWKDAVRVSTTTAGTLASDFENGDAVDGVTLATNDRILIKDQGTGSENGIYIVNASGAPTRATDLDTGDSAASSAVFIQAGTTNGDTAWVCTNNGGSDVVGTDALTFVQFSGGQSPGGSDTQVQYNNSGALGGMSTLTTNGTNLTLNGGNFNIGDSDTLNLGDGSDISLVHNGTNSVLTSTTGDFTVDNTNTTGSSIMLLGSDSSATDFQVQNNSASALFSVDGSGQADFSGNVDATGGVDIDADNVALTVGAGADFSILHDGSSTVMQSGTGNLVIDNTAATSSTIIRTGTDTTATSFQVQNDSADALIRAYGTGDVVISDDLTVQGRMIQTTVVTSESTAGNATYSAAEMLGAYINRDPNGASRTDTTDTAANIVAAIQDAEVGSSFFFFVNNAADADETITLAGGAGVTFSGSTTIDRNDGRRFLAVCTNVTGASEAVTIYDFGSLDADASPGGSDTQMQYNNAGNLAGLSTLTTNGTNVTLTGGNLSIDSGNLNVGDSDAINVGDGNDVSISHDGTDSTVTSATGNLVIDNTNATGTTINRLGSDTVATAFQVQNNSASALMIVQGSGQVDFSGNVDATGGVDIDADNVALTVGAGADFSISHDGSATVMQSDTGNLVIDNTSITSSTIMRLGTDTSATSFAVQNDSASTLFQVQGDGTVTLSGDITATDGLTIDADNVALSIGAGADYTVLHNGTNTVTTSATGDYIVDNTAATGSSIMRLGADTTAVDFQVQNNSETAVLTAYGTGDVVISDDLTVQGRMVQTTTVTTDATVGAKTYLVAELLGGLIRRDPAGASRSDVTDTAANIVGAVQDAEVGSSFYFFIENTADAAEVITLTAGTGVTLVGTMTIDQQDGRRFLAVMTNVTGASEAVTIYDMGSLDADTTPGGSNTEIQFNNNGNLGGISTLTTDGTNLTMAAGEIQCTDAGSLVLGTGADLTIAHAGTNSTVVSATGDLIVDNTNGTGSTIMRLGTDTSATDFQIQNNSETAGFTVLGTGAATFGSTLDVTGITNFNDTTQSTATTNGGVIMDGGLGIAKDVFCGGDVNAVAFNATSDANLKEDIEAIDDPLTLIDNIDAVQYRFSFIEGDHLRYGVLAQDLQDNGLGHIVKQGENGLAVNYNDLTGLLIGAVKELKAEVDLLKNA